MTPFDSYEIHGVHEFNQDGRKFCEQVPRRPSFVLDPSTDTSPGEGAMAIGDFATRVQAEEAFQRITGIPFAGDPRGAGACEGDARGAEMAV